jgi:hypothetical protein
MLQVLFSFSALQDATAIVYTTPHSLDLVRDDSKESCLPANLRLHKLPVFYNKEN